MDELFAMSQKNTNESCKQDVCDTWQTVDSDELFAMRNYNTDGECSYFVCDSVCTKNFENANELCAMARSIAHDAWCEYSCVMICKLHIRVLMLTHV